MNIPDLRQLFKAYETALNVHTEGPTEESELELAQARETLLNALRPLIEKDDDERDVWNKALETAAHAVPAQRSKAAIRRHLR